jgi:hypothetical protein
LLFLSWVCFSQALFFSHLFFSSSSLLYNLFFFLVISLFSFGANGFSSSFSSFQALLLPHVTRSSMTWMKTLQCSFRVGALHEVEKGAAKFVNLVTSVQDVSITMWPTLTLFKRLTNFPTT